jgi:drug/metabolite transporter (DMT)-like permease
MAAIRHSRSERAALAAVVAACVIWGSSFLLAKVALAELPVADVVLWRFALAALVLVPWAARRGLPARRDWPRFALSAFLCVPVTFLPQFEGVARTTVASASLIVGTAPPLLALGAALFRGERPGRRGWTAVALSTAGLAVMIGMPGAGRTLTGDLLVFVSMVTTTAWVLVMMPLVARYGGIRATAWTVALGALFQLPVAWWGGAPGLPATPLGWAALLGLGLGCTAGAYGLWNVGLERLPASRAGVYINLEPVVGAALGVAILGETMSAGLLGGGGLVLAASILASLPSRKPRPEPEIAALPAREVPRRAA